MFFKKKNKELNVSMNEIDELSKLIPNAAVAGIEKTYDAAIYDMSIKKLVLKKSDLSKAQATDFLKEAISDENANKFGTTRQELENSINSSIDDFLKGGRGACQCGNFKATVGTSTTWLAHGL